MACWCGVGVGVGGGGGGGGADELGGAGKNDLPALWFDVKINHNTMERRMETKCAKKDSHFQFTHPVK